MIKIAGLLLVAAIATYGLHAFAQIRADARPTMTPIGSSSSNGISFAGGEAIPERRPMYGTAPTAPDHATSLALASRVSMKSARAVATPPLCSLSLREEHCWREAGCDKGCSIGNSAGRVPNGRSLI